MKVTLNPKWKPRPFQSFLGFMDLKTGVTMALLFALLNKVAGVYGLIAVFTGGSLAQLSMYIYSVLALVAFTWGLKAVGDEDAKRVLYFAHLFFLDHLFSTCWTVFFTVVWWIYTPHDGKRIANSDAQRAMMGGASGYEGHNMTEAERTAAALGIWNKEKGFAAAVLVTGWIIKIYFALLIYSFAYHLRNGTYRPLSRSTPFSYMSVPGSLEAEDDDEEHSTFQDVYLQQGHKRHHVPHSSAASWSDFVGAPKHKRNVLAGENEGASTPLNDDVDEVLFDEDEMISGGGIASSGHSKIGTEETTSVSTNGDELDTQTPIGSSGGRRSR